ncbi:hypothetical protein As57867_003704, partial [Aphanomyces stellatus]
MKILITLTIGALAAANLQSGQPACATLVQTILTAATTNADAIACSKATGLSIDSTDVSSTAINKYLAAGACNKWWSNVVHSIIVSGPPCDLPNVFTGKGILRTTSFNVSFAEFLDFTKKSTLGVPSTLSATTATAKAVHPSSTNSISSMPKPRPSTKLPAATMWQFKTSIHPTTTKALPRSSLPSTAKTTTASTAKPAGSTPKLWTFPPTTKSQRKTWIDPTTNKALSQSSQPSTPKTTPSPSPIRSVSTQIPAPNHNERSTIVPSSKAISPNHMTYATLTRLQPSKVNSLLNDTTKCSANMDALLTAAMTNIDAVACARESGLGLDSTDVSDAALQKYIATASCQLWWANIVKSIHAIAPSCSLPNIFGSDGTLSTATFELSLADFLQYTSHVATGAIKSPVLGTGATQTSAFVCTYVSVVGDATFCASGPICSGGGDAPNGSACPKEGDEAATDCSPA